MGFGRDGREGEFGERFRYADDGFELPYRDGNRGACVGGQFGVVHLASNVDEV